MKWFFPIAVFTVCCLALAAQASSYLKPPADGASWQYQAPFQFPKPHDSFDYDYPKAWAVTHAQGAHSIAFVLSASKTLDDGLWRGVFTVPRPLAKNSPYRITYQLPSGEFTSLKLNPLQSKAEKNAHGLVMSHRYEFLMRWQSLHDLKSGQALRVEYRRLGQEMKKAKALIFPLAGYVKQMQRLEQAVRAQPRGSRHLLKDDEFKTVPFNQWPKLYLTKKVLRYVRGTAKQAGIPFAEAMNYSSDELRKRWHQWADKAAEENVAREKRYQEIEASAPDYMQLNACVKGAAAQVKRHCQQLRAKAYHRYRWVSNVRVYIGRVVAVIWRNKGDILRIEPGNADREIEPVIHYAEESGYSYVIESRGRKLNAYPLNQIAFKRIK